MHVRHAPVIISCKGNFERPLADLEEVTSISKAMAYCVVMSTKEKPK